jgi:Flp pilus assembly protein TadD
MTRFASRLAPRLFVSSLAVLLLGCTALSAPAMAWTLFGGDAKSDSASDAKDAHPAPAADLDGSVRQAQMLRLAGNYDDAIHHLSQLMMVASDDGRVVSEYGKTLAAMGRASEAVQFLSRAQQLQPNDWSVYSAMGVSYDQLGNQKDAQAAYERALALKPAEPSVLVNYALSRMLANDPETAKKLIGRAEIAGADKDAKLARNIVLIRQMAPDNADHAYAVQKPAPAPLAPEARIGQVAPTVHVAQTAPFVTIPTRNTGVVMQRVPVDPLAGPVAAVATHAPRLLAQAPKSNMPVKSADATAQNQAQSLEAKAEAIAKTLAAKPQEKAAVIAKAMTAAPNVLPPVPVKASVKVAAPKASVSAPVVKVAAKPQALVKTAAKETPKKDSVPALRLSANAY